MHAQMDHRRHDKFNPGASTAPAERRLTALTYFALLVADVHQPLHAGRADDGGGNIVLSVVQT